jgi:hypothetical protein
MLDGEQLTTMPRGYVKDHPAAHYLRFKQFLAGREFKAEFATSPRFYPELLTIFRAVAPLVRFLNAPLLDRRRALMQMLPSEDEGPLRDRRRIDRHPEAAASRW